MALIKCPECGKEISDKAQDCIHCGYKLNKNFCPECHNAVGDSDSICHSCGYNLRQKNINNSVNKKYNTYALVGLILGLCSIIAWIIPLFGYPCTIIGIIFSACGVGSEKKPLAITGLILSIIFLIITLINSFMGMLMYI